MNVTGGVVSLEGAPNCCNWNV